MCGVLESKGWNLARVTGSHRIFVRPGSNIRITVPVHGNRTLKIGLQRAITQLAGIGESELSGEQANHGCFATGNFREEGQARMYGGGIVFSILPLFGSPAPGKWLLSQHIEYACKLKGHRCHLKTLSQGAKSSDPSENLTTSLPMLCHQSTKLGEMR